MNLLSQDMKDHFSTLGQVGFDYVGKRPCESAFDCCSKDHSGVV